MTNNQSQDPFAYLQPHQFLVLTTYRKDGRAVPTTVWFAYDQGKIYITTGTNAGKMKRIRNNGHVEMTPSDRTGNLLGEQQVEGHARECKQEEYTHARTVLAQKYGEMFERIAGQRSSERTYIVVEP